MTAGDVYLTYFGGAVALGVIGGLVAITFVLVTRLICFAFMLVLISAEIVLLEVLPSIPARVINLISDRCSAAIAAQKARKARGLSAFRAEPEWQRLGREEAREDATIVRINGWVPACKLLGLPVEGFTKAQLSRAYRKAMRKAHPDLGGSPSHAKAINIARDLIRKQLGWT
ncbi:J domain-containing protein [Tritonibacter mobilis]|uniref:J domain-containing protein n=1 Tax=Tritonibacter mobilis TaxID=379347 RepID=UPI000806CE47|nr:hypothetical protein [Tritonibacter mobilis]GLP88069.1 hypothetical protein GCM10007921_36300 [Tritonibacter mobilis]SDX28612.1 hypothetical protein SAMN05444385_106111 [Tritonibacter mobilis]